MPKYCTAPNCKNDAKNSDRKSFYKFPLHDPARLKQWLKNMGREDWTPSRHQHLCHEHFTPACFTLRWGIRYLANDAIPTIFQLSENTEKRKGADRPERNPKRQRNCNRKPVVTVPAAETPISDTMSQDRDASTLQLYAITVDPSQPGQSVLLDTSNIGHTVGSVHTAVPLPVVDGHGGPIDEVPVTLFQTVDDLCEAGEEEHAEVVVVSESPTVDKEEEVEGLISTILTERQDVVINDGLCQAVPAPSSLTVENVALEMVEHSAAQDERGVQIIAYFETIPNVLPTASNAQPSLPPDTVLSSALSSKPIVSTLPIVSKHLPPSPGSLVLTLERLESVEREGEREAQEEDSTELQEKQLEEHRYHKNSLSKEQLEAIVIELQKKVKVLQQRHRRHLDKLLGLESTVSQLRHSNLINEERLRLLERAYIQTSAAVSDAGETVAIICEEENTTYLYALPKSEVEVELNQE
ncbi:THAP domain-containing protein 5-like isoform X1 [Megalops cyprinoides]|uniref:THAP domain-containing protein 5-like isoform X1 n=2 Tax=Megalops cyprinoides TaxID=118141 RepID=UPI0018651610|nr:THAP domain-containing protein 5-like isoform X1 [Megalops cyprinoides]